MTATTTFVQGCRVIYVGSIAAEHGKLATISQIPCCRRCVRRYMASQDGGAPQMELLTDDGVLLHHVRPQSVIVE